MEYNLKKTLVASFFLLIVALSVLSLASAEIVSAENVSVLLSKTKELTQTQNGTINVTNTGDVAVSVSFVISPTNLNLAIPSPISLGVGESKTINVYSTKNLNTLDLGSHTSTIKAIPSHDNGSTTIYGTNKSVDFTISQGYCAYGAGDTSEYNIEIKTIRDESGGVKWEWNPLQEITVRVDVRNRGEEREDVLVVLGLYDTAEGEFIDLLVDGKYYDELEEEIRLRDGETGTVYFEFKLPLEDIEEGTYLLYVKTFVDGGEEAQCDEGFQEIEIEFEDEVIIDELKYSESVLCNEYSSVSFLVYNLDGARDEEMRVRLYNKELGIDLYSNEFELDVGDSKRVTFDFKIPENATKKSYNIDIIVEYDYRSNSYRSSYSENFMVVVDGNCKFPTYANIYAVLDSDAVAGQEIVVKLIVTNTGADKTTYKLSPTNYESWGKLVSISSSQFELARNEEKEVLLKFLPGKEVSGEKEFKILLAHGDKLDEQMITLYIEEPESSSGGKFINKLKSLVSGYSEDWFIWVLVAFNVVLVLIIIIVVLSVSNKKRRA
jgi:hypothetical protein